MVSAPPDVPGVRHDFVELATGVRAHVASAGPADAPDHLGIERAGLVGHDWGGWAGWLLCLEAPERLRGFLALNIVHPWQPPRRLLLSGWRLSYQWLLGAPWLGSRVVGDGRAMRALMRSSMDDATIEVFLARVREHPERSVALYRQFVLRETPALPRTVRNRRIELPVRVLFGRRDGAQTPLQLRGLRAHAPDCAIELVDATHFVVGQRPDLVADRAHALFADG